MSPYTISSIGLLLDIFGAWLVAWEVVRKYKGEKFYKISPSQCADWEPRSPETDEFIKYENSKYYKMWAGLILLTLGFAAQICSNFIQNGSLTSILPNPHGTTQIMSQIKMPQKKALPVKITPNNPTESKIKKSVE